MNEKEADAIAHIAVYCEKIKCARVVFGVAQGEFNPGELLALWERSVRATARGVRIRFCIWR